MVTDFKNFYCMAICFVTCVIFIISLGMIIHDIADYIHPEFMNRDSLKIYSNNKEFVLYKKNDVYDEKEDLTNLSVEEITAKRLEAKNNRINEIKNRVSSNIANKAIWLIMGLLFFLIHWKLYKQNIDPAVV